FEQSDQPRDLLAQVTDPVGVCPHLSTGGGKPLVVVHWKEDEIRTVDLDPARLSTLAHCDRAIPCLLFRLPVSFLTLSQTYTKLVNLLATDASPCGTEPSKRSSLW